jgi:hypothetical protein
MLSDVTIELPVYLLVANLSVYLLVVYLSVMNAIRGND